tara:strand:+ start:679 stop:834 length:156 start_codon:yes stop_codon:yes gene_type:complete
MATFIAFAIAIYFCSKLFGTTSIASNSFEEDLDDYIAMDIVSDGEFDGDFH